MRRGPCSPSLSRNGEAQDRARAPRHHLWQGVDTGGADLGRAPGTPRDRLRNAADRALRGELCVDHVVAQVRATRQFTAPFRWFDGVPDGGVLLHPERNKVAAACILLRTTSALCGVS